MHLSIVFNFFISPDLDQVAVIEGKFVRGVFEVGVLDQDTLECFGLKRNVVQPFSEFSYAYM